MMVTKGSATCFPIIVLYVEIFLRLKSASMPWPMAS